MHEIDTSKIDLNLLITLDAVLTEGSVTRAARRLGVGQPAVSHALGRLRELFDDPLFVRSGRSIVPTPRADALRVPLTRLLTDAARLVSHALQFDPATTTRSFGLACPDLLAPVLPEMSARMYAEAPEARLEIRDRRLEDTHALEAGEVDMVLGPGPAEGAGLCTRGLGAVHFGVVVCRDHPALDGDALTAEAWVEYPHVMVLTGNRSRSFVGTALRHAGLSRRIGLVVPTFLSALVTVSETEFMFAAPRELVRPLLPRLGLVAVDLPIPLDAVPIVALWHERFQSDPAHQFFRTLVLEQFEASIGLRPSPTTAV